MQELQSHLLEVMNREGGSARNAEIAQQASLLRRGHVSRTELLQAIDDTVACAEAEGVEFDSNGLDWSGLTIYHDFVNTELSDGRLAVEAYDECYERHARYVHEWYEMGITPHRNAIAREIEMCVERAGLDVASRPEGMPMMRILGGLEESGTEDLEFATTRCFELHRYDDRSGRQHVW